MSTPTDADIEKYRSLIATSGALPEQDYRINGPCPVCGGTFTLAHVAREVSRVWCDDCKPPADLILDAWGRIFGPVYELTADGESIRRVEA